MPKCKGKSGRCVNRPTLLLARDILSPRHIGIGIYCHDQGVIIYEGKEPRQEKVHPIPDGQTEPSAQQGFPQRWGQEDFLWLLKHGTAIDRGIFKPPKLMNRFCHPKNIKKQGHGRKIQSLCIMLNTKLGESRYFIANGPPYSSSNCRIFLSLLRQLILDDSLENHLLFLFGNLCTLENRNSNITYSQLT